MQNLIALLVGLLLCTGCARGTRLVAIINPGSELGIKDDCPVLANGIKVGALHNITGNDSVSFVADLQLEPGVCLATGTEFRLERTGVLSTESHITAQHIDRGRCLQPADSVWIIPSPAVVGRPLTDTTLLRAIDTVILHVDHAIRAYRH